MVEPKRSALLTALALALAAHAQLPLGYDNIIMFNCPGMATGCRLLGYHPLTTVSAKMGIPPPLPTVHHSTQALHADIRTTPDTKPPLFSSILTQGCG